MLRKYIIRCLHINKMCNVQCANMYMLQYCCICIFSVTKPTSTECTYIHIISIEFVTLPWWTWPVHGSCRFCLVFTFMDVFAWLNGELPVFFISLSHSLLNRSHALEQSLDAWLAIAELADWHLTYKYDNAGNALDTYIYITQQHTTPT